MSMKNIKKRALMLVPVLLVLAALYYYIALPAINIHNASIWKLLIAIPVILLIFYSIPKVTFTGKRNRPMELNMVHRSSTFKLLFGIILVLVLIYGVGTLLSSPVINASKYQKLLSVEKGEFSEDIAQIS